MINKIISIIISAVLSFSGIQLLSPDELIDTFSEAFFGIPFSTSSIKENFLSNIEEADIEIIGRDSGIVKNRIVVITKSGISFGEKHKFFKNENLKAVGWCAPIDIFVVSCKQADKNAIDKECRRLMKNENVKLALPLSVSKIISQGTPNDQYYLFDDLEKCNWDELNPDGSEAWLEIINARQAWDYESYYKPVKLGVVDMGFSTRHPELKNKITFPNFWKRILNFPDVHGTHVAGIIAANRNDGIGVAGICSHATLVCADCTPPLVWNANLSVLFNFVAIVKAGARVVNLSLGKSQNAESGQLEAMNEVIKADETLCYYTMARLLEKGYDFLCVQANGNGDGFGIPIDAHYNGIFCSLNENTSFPELSDIPVSEMLNRIVIVGSTTYDAENGYHQSIFSNVGECVDIVAPGEEILSTMTDESYVYLSGTSMSAPMVTGVAGLILSINPKLTSKEVKEIILSSTDRVSKKLGYLTPESDAVARDLPILNAKLCVEEALRRTYSDMGTVSGTVDLNGEKNAIVSFGGKEYTAFSDGSFSFVAKAGSGVLEVTLSDGTKLLSCEITVTAGETTVVSSQEPTVEPPIEE